MTPFRKMVVPPPMAAFAIQLPTFAQQVCFSLAPNTNNFAVILADQRVAIYEYRSDDVQDDTVRIQAAGGTGFSVQTEMPKCCAIYSICTSDGTIVQTQLFHFLWISSSMMVCISQEKHIAFLHQLEITESGIFVKSSLTLEKSVIGMCHDHNIGRTVVQLKDGGLLTYDPDSQTVVPMMNNSGKEITFPQPCVQIELCKLDGEEVVLGLTERYRLYGNDSELTNSCTSFALHADFLVLTTHAHICQCVSLDKSLAEIVCIVNSQVQEFDKTMRRVERGSRIVTLVRDDTNLILQMPRGNLESIHPRSLVLDTVRHHLNR